MLTPIVAIPTELRTKEMIELYLKDYSAQDLVEKLNTLEPELGFSDDILDVMIRRIHKEVTNIADHMKPDFQIDPSIREYVNKYHPLEVRSEFNKLYITVEVS